MQDLREQQRIITRWENSWLSPPDDEEPTYVCCICDNEADYEIDHDYYCKRCLDDAFRIRR